MARYIALVDGGSGAWGVVFPDCDGCTAMGETVDQALALATDALREWMADRKAAGLAPPAPRSADDIRNDEGFVDDITGGALLASVPLLLDEGRSVRANVSLDAGLLGAIDEAARMRGLTRSAFLASAAREKIAAGG